MGLAKQETVRERIDTLVRPDAQGVPVDDVDAIESVILSRYQRPRPQGWFPRLLGAPPSLGHVLQVQLRSTTQEHARFEAWCDDDTLLHSLPWLDLKKAIRAPLADLLATLHHLLDADARLAVGPLNARPAIHIDTTLHKLLSIAHGHPSKLAWMRICRLCDRIDDEIIYPHLQDLQTALASWPDHTRKPPKRWYEAKPKNQPFPLGLFLSSIEDLSLSHNTTLDIQWANPWIPFYDLTVFSLMTSLRALNLAHIKKVDSLEPLSTCTSLTQLIYHNCSKISTLQPIASLSSLEKIRLTGCQKIRDIEPLEALSHLSMLYLKDLYRVVDVTPLAKLSNLWSLDLFGLKPSDWSPLKELGNLQDLGLFDTSFSDLNLLTNLPKLRSITVWKSLINDLSPLLEMDLQRVSLSDIPKGGHLVIQQLEASDVQVRVEDLSSTIYR